MQKLTKIILAIVASFGLITFCTLPTYADDVCNPSVPEEIRQAAGCDGASSSTTAQDIITNILYSIIGVLGLVAVIFIVKGGIEYILSTGDAAKIQKAKSTIFYAVIGLAVCALAFIIVNFTINIINSNSQSSGGGANNNSSQQVST